ILQENAEHFDSEGDVHDAIGGLLSSFSTEVSEKEVDELCSRIYALMSSQNFKDHEQTLDAPVHMATLLDNFSDKVADNNSIWMAKREMSSVVDLKKLEKAEAKLKEKQEKKGLNSRTVGSRSTKSLDNGEDVATVSQQIDRRDIHSTVDSSGRFVGDIRIENFDVCYGSRVLLQGANLTLSYGRRYGFVGRNGFGKTTLLRALSRRDFQLPPGLRVLHVEQEIPGDSTPALESVVQADTERTALLSQLAQLKACVSSNGLSVPTDSATEEEKKYGHLLAEVYARLAAIEADKAPARAAVILHGLGFNPEMQKRPTKEFSGGWRMRLSLAQALFAKPDLLLLDEPTNMLDMRALIWLEEYLRSSSNIMVIVSHDRSFLNNVATDIIHLTSRRLDVYRGNYDAFEQARADRLLAQQREYEAQQAERAHIQQFIDKFRYKANHARLVQSRVKMLERLPQLTMPEKDPKIIIHLPICDKLSSPVLQLDEVCFHYVPEKPILYKVDLSISSDSRICIVGENGAGKTTLLRVLLGQLEPTSGMRHTHRGLRVGYFSQHHVDQLDLNLNSLEFLMRKFPSQNEQTYRSQLAGFNITDMLALQPIGSLSGGQKSRVAFAAMCMSNPNLLVLDEPTNHLDVETIGALSDALRSFQGGVVLVSHDERLIETVCNEVWVCTRMGKDVDETKGSRVYALTDGLQQYKKAVRMELEELTK
ncbi:ATP-binding cassette sub-family F member 3, partial [Clonorchis sinensis]